MYSARLLARKAAAVSVPALSRSISSSRAALAPPLVKVNVDGKDVEVPGTVTQQTEGDDGG